MAMQHVRVNGAMLEVAERGAGDPVVFIQTALTADELSPLASELALKGYRTILYHRRGYAGSTPLDGPGSVAQDAADCGALIEALGVRQAHIVGFSYSGAVALQLAAGAPERVLTLVLIEPPPLHTPSAADFREANDQLIRTRRTAGPQAALDEFLTLIIGPLWREAAETELPGSVAQMERDTATFFDSDLPALLAWQFGREDARRITCPVLHVGATNSGRLFAEVRELMLEWFPDAEDVLIEGADHTLVLTHPTEVAAALAGFLERHRLPR